jgi:uncharacterized protein (DUF697 family)
MNVAPYNTGKGWQPLFNKYTNRFIGTIHGRGHVIRNLFINCPDSSNIGLFGVVGTSGIIDSLNIAGCNITGYDYVGSLVGDNEGTVSYCYSTGSVSAHYSVGGLVGFMSANGTVTSCYSSVSVAGYFTIGGLVGYSAGIVDISYSSGTVSGIYIVGGLVGTSNGIVSTCYYDKTTSIQNSGSGSGGGSITGYTTLQMKQHTNFTFDFTHTWGITEGKTYPALRGVNNAPYAFADTLKVHGNTLLAPLLANDYDYETGQTKLVLRVTKLYGTGTTDSVSYFSFPISNPLGYTDSLLYKVGEVTAPGDTLWGNQAKVLLIKSNSKPVVTSIALLTATQGLEYVYTVTASDADADNLTYGIAGAPIGMTLMNNVINWVPASGVTTSGSVTLKVSDGIDTVIQTFTIAVTPITGIKDLVETSINILPNPFKDIVFIQSQQPVIRVCVYSLAGIKLIDASFNSTSAQINTQHLVKGAYVFEVKTKYEIYKKLMIKE